MQSQSASLVALAHQREQQDLSFRTVREALAALPAARVQLPEGLLRELEAAFSAAPAITAARLGCHPLRA
jgi:hypothetical protein